jgi:hypothetical protein
MVKKLVMAAAIVALVAGAPARAVVVDDKKVDTLVGQHFRTLYSAFLWACPQHAGACDHKWLDEGVGFTVVGTAPDEDEGVRSGKWVEVRLDDGRVGFFTVETTRWTSDKEKAATHASIARNVAHCVAAPAATIGMTEQEVLDSKWGHPSDVNATTLAIGERVQWAYRYGPQCHQSLKSGYLYFENGKLVAIQE